MVAALDTSTATRTVSLLSSPPTTDKYSAIKTFLISAYDLSDSERASALFNLPGLGDSNPSELMDSMLSLLGTHTPCFLFRHLFLQQLPDYVRAPLAPSSTDNYRALAQEADKIYLAGRQNLQEVNIPQHTTAHHNTPPEPNSASHRRTDNVTFIAVGGDKLQSVNHIVNTTLGTRETSSWANGKLNRRWSEPTTTDCD